MGEGIFSLPYVAQLLQWWLSPETAASLGFVVSFILVMSLLHHFDRPIPPLNRQVWLNPERYAMRVVRPMRVLAKCPGPCGLVFTPPLIANTITRLAKGCLPLRDDQITSPDDILALAEVGIRSGALIEVTAID